MTRLYERINVADTLGQPALELEWEADLHLMGLEPPKYARCSQGLGRIHDSLSLPLTCGLPCVNTLSSLN